MESVKVVKFQVELYITLPTNPPLRSGLLEHHFRSPEPVLPIVYGIIENKYMPPCHVAGWDDGGGGAMT